MSALTEGGPRDSSPHDDPSPAERAVALTALDSLRYLSVAWHNKFSTEELSWLDALHKRIREEAGL